MILKRKMIKWNLSIDFNIFQIKYIKYIKIIYHMLYMCFNAQVSLLTYLVGMIGCYLLFLESIPEAIFLAWVIQMQLIEFILWKNQPCNSINRSTSKIGMLINNSEPIVLWLAIILFSKKNIPKWLHILMILYFIASIFYNYSIYDNCTIPSTTSSNLEWKWNNGNNSILFYAFFLVCCILLSIYGLEYGYHMASIFIVSFILSYSIYKNTHAIGSMWCFFAAFCPFLLLVIYKIKS
jgi:hypothetical protein